MHQPFISDKNTSLKIRANNEPIIYLQGPSEHCSNTAKIRH